MLVPLPRGTGTIPSIRSAERSAMHKEPFFSSLLSALEALRGPGTGILSKKRIFGGDISTAEKLTLTDGSLLFMKSNTLSAEAMFRAEYAGLTALRHADALPVPEPLCYGRDESLGASFLLMEYISPAPRRKDYWEALGRGLALLHRADTAFLHEGVPGPLYGFPENNFIGSSPQVNTWKGSFAEFFAACRLEPQIRMASPFLPESVLRSFSSLLGRMDRYLPEPAFPSLLHGDLWSGNVMTGPEGRAVIMDPAVYAGSLEADLAMTALFGGFPESFYAAYREITPADPSFRDRKDLYNLYHLLNHLNLFGETYYYDVLAVLRRYAS